LAVFHMIDGRSDEAKRIVDEHVKEKRSLHIYKSLGAGFDGECTAAVGWLDSVSAIPGRYLMSVRFQAAMCYYNNGEHNGAVDQLRMIVDLPMYSIDNAVVIPKSFYRLGKSYEELGQATLALENYKRFLEIWKDADEDQADLIDAKARVAALTAAGSM
ncbi:MAG: tetratricopeptide repeat protein, partial [Candidatus Krumholzibacteria bacterium]|nr:tetratricopeptide repeat protein [Candidatus Krumholzibacteria bacterium]